LLLIRLIKIIINWLRKRIINCIIIINYLKLIIKRIINKIKKIIRILTLKLCVIINLIKYIIIEIITYYICIK